MSEPPRIWWDGYDFWVLVPSKGIDSGGQSWPRLPSMYRMEAESDYSTPGRRDGFELAPRTRQLRLLAVAEAARALLDNYHCDAEAGLSALGAALDALDGEQK